MTLRELLNIMPDDRPTTIDLRYYDEREIERGDTYSFQLGTEDPDYLFAAIMLEHYADDDVIEMTNHFNSILITVDRVVHDVTVRRWKTEAADQAKLSYILRDWKED